MKQIEKTLTELLIGDYVTGFGQITDIRGLTIYTSGNTYSRRLDENEVVLVEPKITLDWIPVQEAMPEQGREVLIWTKWGNMAVGCKEWEQGHDPDHWRVDGARYEMRDVTHWSPKPEPPTA